VSREFQRKGLGKIILFKLAEAARENGISGLIAYTSPNNQGMIRLFKALPFKTRTSYDSGVVSLTCRFSEPKHE
jgi:L-amino acid N-acyltransferase YncA